MPSVLGLKAGELMEIESMVTFLHMSNRKWNCGLFWIFTPLTVMFELVKNLKA